MHFSVFFYKTTVLQVVLTGVVCSSTCCQYISGTVRHTLSCVLMTVEVLIRMIASMRTFWQYWANIVDFIITIACLLSLVLYCFESAAPSLVGLYGSGHRCKAIMVGAWLVGLYTIYFGEAIARYARATSWLHCFNWGIARPLSACCRLLACRLEGCSPASHSTNTAAAHGR